MYGFSGSINKKHIESKLAYSHAEKSCKCITTVDHVNLTYYIRESRHNLTKKSYSTVVFGVGYQPVNRYY